MLHYEAIRYRKEYFSEKMIRVHQKLACLLMIRIGIPDFVISPKTPKAIQFAAAPDENVA